MAYRLYQFPFMDAFLRDVLTGVTLLAIFCFAYTIGFRSSDMMPLWMASVALALAFAKTPVSRWVDRTFLGYVESVDDQEERIANAVRGLTVLSEFTVRVSEIVRQELGADWVAIESEPRKDAVAHFQIRGSSPMWLSLGPRKGARTYMSRQLQLARRAVLELSTQHERLQREETERHQLVQQHELREITARAQMRALQAQINPHFLFNTLNVLANLIHSNPQKAEHVTEDLAEIFRYALDSTRREWVRLEDELRFIQSYLEIEKSRFEERLTYTFDVAAAVRSARIPPMILQPLVENAIRHGIGPKIEGGRIRVSGNLKGDQIQIAVEDTGVGLSHKGRAGNGIGLANIRERLMHVYGQTAALRLEAAIPHGTRAVLMLPQHDEVPA
jgi:signal transduction histidine kinase